VLRAKADAAADIHAHPVVELAAGAEQDAGYVPRRIIQGKLPGVEQVPGFWIMSK
jgi:hypothetical protein